MKLSDFTNLSGQFVKPSGEGSFCPAWDLYQPSK